MMGQVLEPGQADADAAAATIVSLKSINDMHTTPHSATGQSGNGSRAADPDPDFDPFLEAHSDDDAHGGGGRHKRRGRGWTSNGGGSGAGVGASSGGGASSSLNSALIATLAAAAASGADAISPAGIKRTASTDEALAFAKRLRLDEQPPGRMAASSGCILPEAAALRPSPLPNPLLLPTAATPSGEAVFGNALDSLSHEQRCTYARDSFGRQLLSQLIDQETQCMVECGSAVGIFSISTERVHCLCASCGAKRWGQSTAFLPSEFERHAGMAACKKWRFSIKVCDSPGMTLGRWLDMRGITLSSLPSKHSRPGQRRSAISPLPGFIPRPGVFSQLHNQLRAQDLVAAAASVASAAGAGAGPGCMQGSGAGGGGCSSDGAVPAVGTAMVERTPLLAAVAGAAGGGREELAEALRAALMQAGAAPLDLTAIDPSQQLLPDSISAAMDAAVAVAAADGLQLQGPGSAAAHASPISTTNGAGTFLLSRANPLPSNFTSSMAAAAQPAGPGATGDGMPPPPTRLLLGQILHSLSQASLPKGGNATHLAPCGSGRDSGGGGGDGSVGGAKHGLDGTWVQTGAPNGPEAAAGQLPESQCQQTLMMLLHQHHQQQAKGASDPPSHPVSMQPSASAADHAAQQAAAAMASGKGEQALGGDQAAAFAQLIEQRLHMRAMQRAATAAATAAAHHSSSQPPHTVSTSQGCAGPADAVATASGKNAAFRHELLTGRTQQQQQDAAVQDARWSSIVSGVGTRLDGLLEERRRRKELERQLAAHAARVADLERQLQEERGGRAKAEQRLAQLHALLESKLEDGGAPAAAGGRDGGEEQHGMDVEGAGGEMSGRAASA